MPSLIGAIISTPDVEDAITSTLSLWIDEYLGEVEDQHDQARGTISRPRSYNATYDFENWPESQLPSVAVVCPGTVGALERAGLGAVNAWFEATLSVIVTGQDEADARRVAGLYQSAIATLLEQQGSLRASSDTPFAQNTLVMSTETRLPDVENRTLAVGSVTVRSMVNGIFDRLAGPVGPPPSEPVGQWPTVLTTSVDLVAAEQLPDDG
jgi:hypothetical protein